MGDPDQEEPPVEEEEPGPDLSINVAYQCAMKGSVTRFLTCFESEEDPYHEVNIFIHF